MYATSLERCKYWKQCNKCEQCKPFMWRRYLQLWWYCHYYDNILPLLALMGQVDHAQCAHCECTVYHYYWGEMYVFSGAGCLSMKRGYWELCLSFFPLACKEKRCLAHPCVRHMLYHQKNQKHHLSFGLQRERLLLFSFLAFFLFSFNYIYH